MEGRRVRGPRAGSSALNGVPSICKNAHIRAEDLRGAQPFVPLPVVAGAREKGMTTRDFARQIDGYGLTTADILYRLPDHPSILQQYIWQEYDKAPLFPELNRFLAFWEAKLEGLLYRVTVCHKTLIGPAELRAINGEFRLH